MGSAGESTLVEVVETTDSALRRALRNARVDGLSPQDAQRVLAGALSLEKVVAGLKVLVADRATSGRSPKEAAEDLARRSGTSAAKARSVLDASKKVQDHPEARDALAGGDLSEDQATAIADAAAVNPGAAGRLVDQAKTEPLENLRDACGRAKAAADPDPETTHQRIHRHRFFRHGTDAEGAFTASIRCTTSDGARFMAHLAPFREQVFTSNRQKAIRDPYEAIELDALLAMAEASTSGEGAKARAQVNVVVDWHALMGLPTGHLGDDEPAAYLAGHGPIPVSEVRRIMEDAFLVGLLRDGTDITKIRRYGRHIPAEVRDAVMVKHRYQCAEPGCTNTARLEMDHVHPYAKGGETSTTNLQPRCTPCHRAKTARDRLFDDTG